MVVITVYTVCVFLQYHPWQTVGFSAGRGPVLVAAEVEFSFV